MWRSATPVQTLRVPNVRVLIVDDQPAVREVVHELVDGTPGFEAAGEASSGPDALDVVAETRPELVLLDVRMPGMDGIETARRMVARHPDVVVVLVSADEPEDLPAEVSSCGAAGYVRKRELGPHRLRRLWSAVGVSTPT